MDKITNAADPKQVKEASRKEKNLIQDHLKDLEEIMSSQTGRRFISFILDFCEVEKTSFNHSGSMLYFNEGKKNFAYYLMDKIKTNFIDLFHQMEREKIQREETTNV